MQAIDRTLLNKINKVAFKLTQYNNNNNKFKLKDMDDVTQTKKRLKHKHVCM